MKFKIQAFDPNGSVVSKEIEIYVSLRIDMNGRLSLRASNTKGDSGQDILTIGEDGKLYRPVGVRINGLATVNQRIMLGDLS